MYQSADLFIFSTYSQGRLVGPFYCETCDSPSKHVYISFYIDYFLYFSPVPSQIHVTYTLTLLGCCIMALFLKINLSWLLYIFNSMNKENSLPHFLIF